MQIYDITSPIIQYSNDIEYQELFRFIFYNTRTQIDKNNIDNDDDIFYDETLVNTSMDKLYQFTKKNILFQTLYKKAAARIMSTDKSFGQCILFSYDYFSSFHPCICRFLYDYYCKNTPELIEHLCQSSPSIDMKSIWENLGEWNEDNIYYRTLLEKLS